MSAVGDHGRLRGADVAEMAIREVLEAFDVPAAAALSVAGFLAHEVSCGLGPSGSSLAMLPTYVTPHRSFPRTGRFFGLDLGATNFRVVVCTIEAGALIDEQIHRFPLPSNELQGVPASHLFDFLAKCVGEVVGHLAPTHTIAAALAFGFGIDVRSIDRGRVIKWAKGFDFPDALGCDILDMMNAALDRRSLGHLVQMVAVINDTVGAFISGLFDEPNASVAVIVGTGTNMCYVEQDSAITKLPVDDARPETMLLNTEWGALADVDKHVFPLNRFDTAVDEGSTNHGQQLFEKMIAGTALGELVRLALGELQEAGVFTSRCDALAERHGIEAPLVAAFAEDITQCHGRIQEFCEKLHWVTTIQDRRIIHRTAAAVIRRAGRLVAAGIWGIATHLRRTDDCCVIMDGSVWAHGTAFRSALTDALQELAPRPHGVRLVTAEDASGKGAALLAALYAS